MAEPNDPTPEIEVIFTEEFAPDGVAPQEIELLGSVFPELVAELIQTKEEK